jgi:hypothetical protein
MTKRHTRVSVPSLSGIQQQNDWRRWMMLTTNPIRIHNQKQPVRPEFVRHLNANLEPAYGGNVNTSPAVESRESISIRRFELNQSLRLNYFHPL